MCNSRQKKKIKLMKLANFFENCPEVKNFNVVLTDLNGVLLLSFDVFEDHRGYFYESYHRLRYADFGINVDFCHSMDF